MFDAFNFNIGGSSGPHSYNGANATGVPGVTSQTVRRPGLSEYVKKARAVIKQLDVASLDYWELADEIWNHTSDAQKIHFYRLIDALIDRALIHHDAGTAFTLVEQAIGERATMLREAVYNSGGN